jgi:hypothetical protein
MTTQLRAKIDANADSFTMTVRQIRSASGARNTAYPVFVRATPYLALAIGLITFSPAAMACGGGGSGSYRKPPRPDQYHEKIMSNPQGETRSDATKSPDSAKN